MYTVSEQAKECITLHYDPRNYKYMVQSSNNVTARWDMSTGMFVTQNYDQKLLSHMLVIII
jgi:hypothetical protein